jgi:hypothetical protein
VATFIMADGLHAPARTTLHRATTALPARRVPSSSAPSGWWTCSRSPAASRTTGLVLHKLPLRADLHRRPRNPGQGGSVGGAEFPLLVRRQEIRGAVIQGFRLSVPTAENVPVPSSPLQVPSTAVQ